MIDLSQLFDRYSRQARLYPALLALSPAIAVSLSIWPSLGTGSWGSIGVGLGASLGVLFLLIELARTQGKRVEPALLVDWGGWPTTLWLRHSSSHLSPLTRARYHNFLSASVPQLLLPSEADEANDLLSADDRYASGVQWLKERARSGYPLVERENASYGFRRNLLGLKPVGVVISIVSLAVEISYFWYAQSASTFWALLHATDAAQFAVIAFLIASLAAWAFVVRRTWVREAGDAYARALLATCDA